MFCSQKKQGMKKPKPRICILTSIPSLLFFIPHPTYKICSKSIVNLVFLKNYYLFMNIYFVFFKVISTRYNTLVQTFFPILEVLQYNFLLSYLASSSVATVLLAKNSRMSNIVSARLWLPRHQIYSLVQIWVVVGRIINNVDWYCFWTKLSSFGTFFWVWDWSPQNSTSYSICSNPQQLI